MTFSFDLDCAVNCTDIPAYEKMLRRLPPNVRKSIAGVNACFRRGELKKCDRRIALYLSSFEARSAAVRSATGKLRGPRRPGAEERIRIAKRLDPYIGTDEPVNVLVKDKPDGSIRFIMEFGVENRALQELLLPVLWATSTLHPSLYTMRGVHAAAAQVKSLMEAGHVWAIQTDIRNFYPSFEADKCQVLVRLPKKVITNTLFATHLNLVSTQCEDMFGLPGISHHSVIANELVPARQGMPQGSAVSPIVADMAMSKVLRDIPAGCVVAYADNVLILAKTEESAVAMTQALWSAIEAAPVGHFRPKSISTAVPGCTFVFLGHTFKIMNGSVRVGVTTESRGELEQRCRKAMRRIRAEESAARRVQKIRRLREYVRSWTAAFSLCDGMDTLRDECLSAIDALKQ